MPTLQSSDNRAIACCSRLRSCRALTLVELAVAATLLTIAVVSVFSSLLYARRMSESSIFQNAAITTVQGYVEQMKNMPLADLPYVDTGGNTVSGAGATSTEIPTRLSGDTPDTLILSTSSVIPDISNIGLTASTALPGVTDNIKLIDINSTPSDTTDDLRMNIRVWIRDITNNAISATQVRSITIQYAWQGGLGRTARLHRATLRTIRSAVPTY